MATTFVLEELDDATRSYLTEVRDREGSGMPGVYCPVGHPWGCGCGCGPIVIGLTLLLTLTTWLGVIYNDPDRVALLQTAGLLVGGWLFFAAYRGRGKRGDKANAGFWVYADPLHLYQARAEQVAVTPIADVGGAAFSHTHDNNGNYQNSTVAFAWDGGRTLSFQVNDRTRAEQIVTFMNYIIWARGPEGGVRAGYSPGDLGALGSAVARTESEPQDADGNPSPALTGVDVRTVPENPTRERRSLPRVLPYIVMILAGAGCFFLLRQLDISLRDDALFEDFIKKDPVFPQMIRLYLLDPRNTHHRDEATRILASFYDTAIPKVRERGTDPDLREGMAKVLESLRAPDLPAVSVRVTEAKPMPGTEGGTADRARNVRERIDTEVARRLTSLTRPINNPNNVQFDPPMPPVGEQLIAFAQMPDDAPNPHFDITYRFEPAGKEKGKYELVVEVVIRTDVTADPVTRKTLTVSTYTPDQAAAASSDLVEKVVTGLMGP